MFTTEANGALRHGHWRPLPSLAVLPTSTQSAQPGKLCVSHCPESPAGGTGHRKHPAAGGPWTVSSATVGGQDEDHGQAVSTDVSLGEDATTSWWTYVSLKDPRSHVAL